jgi:hypothetical protein
MAHGGGLAEVAATAKPAPEAPAASDPPPKCLWTFDGGKQRFMCVRDGCNAQARMTMPDPSVPARGCVVLYGGARSTERGHTRTAPIADTGMGRHKKTGLLKPAPYPVGPGEGPGAQRSLTPEKNEANRKSNPLDEFCAPTAVDTDNDGHLD